MAEFNVHHDVHRLIQILGVRTDPSRGVTEDVVADNLLKSINQTNRKVLPTATFLKKLDTPKNSDFRPIYDELKAKNIIEVDPTVQLLARIADSVDVKNFLKFHKRDRKSSKDTNTAKSSSDTNLSADVNAARPRHTSSSSHKESDENEPANRVAAKSFKRDLVKHKHDQRLDFTFLSYDFSPFDGFPDVQIPSLANMSITEQQNALINDLLYVLVGIDGRYIRRTVTPDKRMSRLIVNDGADKLLKTLVERIITICPLYSVVIFFIEHHDYGLVNQALISFMKSIVHEYFLLITQLENQHRLGDMTLQKMWYFLQDIYSKLEILKQVSLKIRQGKCIGGAVLSILHEKTVSHLGNIRASEFCMKMTSVACEPYFRILEQWISGGLIFDEYKEFFIEDNGGGEEHLPGVNDDFYWENRYETVSNKIPIFLARLVDKILRTGMYLTVIRECGNDIETTSNPEPLQYTTEERVYAERIGVAYQYASKKILRILLDESNLVAHLNSVKHYFFMDKGDFIVLFMDIAENELKKDIDSIVPTRLQSLLELAVRTSAMSQDPHADLLGIDLLPDSVCHQLSRILGHGEEDSESNFSDSTKGYEALALRYKVEWPLSLILNQRNIGRYQMLFRHLFYCKYVERQLGTTWKDSKISKHFALRAIKTYAEAFGLRQKMLNFVQNLEYYMMVEVIEPNFHNFIQKVKEKEGKVNSIDDMITEHTIFMDECLQDCMLTQKRALKLMVRLLDLCMEFSEFMHKNHQLAAQFELEGANDMLLKAHEFETITEECEERDSTSTLSFEKRITKLHEDFNENLQALLKEIVNQQNDHYTGKMLHILYRLDFNEYYSKIAENHSRPT